MSPIGSYLREQRAARGISLEDLARATRISPRYLQALEAEQFQELPAPVFTKGFIRAYCQAIDLLPDEALRRYGAQTGQSVAPGYRPPVHGTTTRGLPKSAPVVLSLVLLMVLGGALLVLTWALRDGSRSAAVRGEAPIAPRVEPTAPSAPTPAPVGTAAPSPSTATAPVEAPATRGGGSRPLEASPSAVPSRVVAAYRLVARATEKTWVRVQTEGGQALAEEIIPAGEVREWSSNRRFVLTVGNAGGIALELNGQPLPRLGASGSVVRGVIVPPDRP
jgi:cytoskeleton protein RodZ